MNFKKLMKKLLAILILLILSVKLNTQNTQQLILKLKTASRLTYYFTKFKFEDYKIQILDWKQLENVKCKFSFNRN
jgi:hypothetical protein